jgi:hypothetical protein
MDAVGNKTDDDTELVADHSPSLAGRAYVAEKHMHGPSWKAPFLQTGVTCTASATAGVLGAAVTVIPAGTTVNDSGDAIGGAAPDMTLTDAAAKFLAVHVGSYITIASATTPANNGTFLITGWTSTSVITYLNPLGVAEAFAGTWSIYYGQKDPYDLHCVHVEAISNNNGTYSILFFRLDTGAFIGMTGCTKVATGEVVGDHFIQTPVLPAGTGVSARIAFSGGAAGTVTFAVWGHSY